MIFSKVHIKIEITLYTPLTIQYTCSFIKAMLCRVLNEMYEITEKSVMMSGVTDNILDLGLNAHGATLHLFNLLFSFIPLEVFYFVFHKLQITHSSAFFADK